MYKQCILLLLVSLALGTSSVNAAALLSESKTEVSALIVPILVESPINNFLNSTEQSQVNNTERVANNTEQEVNNTEQEVNNTEQEDNNREQTVNNTEQEVNNTEQEVNNTEHEVNNAEQEINNTEQEKNVTVSTETPLSPVLQALGGNYNKSKNEWTKPLENTMARLKLAFDKYDQTKLNYTKEIKALGEEVVYFSHAYKTYMTLYLEKADELENL